jgi:hypothetical protein
LCVKVVDRLANKSTRELGETDLWDQKMTDYDEKTVELVANLENRQQVELEEWHEEAAQRAMLRPKFSRELLDLRKIQQSLARQRKYEEAQLVKFECDEKEDSELRSM